MQKKVHAVIIFIIAICVVSCQRQQVETHSSPGTPEKTRITPSSVIVTQQPPNDFDFQQALRLMLKSPDMVFSDNLGIDSVAINTAVEWTGLSGINHCEPLQTPSSSTSANQFECTKILLAEPYLQHGEEQILMLTETISSECHVCFPILTFAIFESQAEGWILVSKQSDFSSIGSWGQAPPAELIKIGQNRFGILFHHNNTSSGISFGEMILVSELNGEFQTVLREQIALRNLEEEWGYESAVTFIEDADSDWHKIQITTSGTIPISATEQGLESIEEEKWFVWDEGSYRLAE
ncbi:MAG: hypothetical protein R3D55_24295 [Chloroflexota bacterium]